MFLFMRASLEAVKTLLVVIDHVSNLWSRACRLPEHWYMERPYQFEHATPLFMFSKLMAGYM